MSDPAPLVGQWLTVHKRTSTGQPVIAWEGRVVAQDESQITIEAEFTRGFYDLGVFTIDTGDIFHETYYLARWWNVFQVWGRDGVLRGWYCNITRPPLLVGQDLYYDDLALDLLLSPTGKLRLADEDEFEALRLAEREPEAYRQARQAVAEIHALIERRCPPFEALAAHEKTVQPEARRRAPPFEEAAG